jgi:zinc/manganese transport system ATP-binding protein
MSVPSALAKQSPVLDIRKLSVRLGDKDILKSINVQIQPGEFIGLIGANGAGKSTLLKVILGLLPVAGGSVAVFGKPARRGNRLIGYVPQKLHLDRDTPLRGWDLAALGFDGHRFGIPLPSREKRRRVDEMLVAVDAARYADAPVGRLSGGEQQRLLIAQALLTDPRLLLLDEPLSNLDIGSAHEVVGLVSRLARDRGMTVILVAHDMNPLLPVVDRVLYLADGNAAIGRVDDIFRNDVLSGLYGYAVEVLRVNGRILVVGCRDFGNCGHLLSAETHCSGGIA